MISGDFLNKKILLYVGLFTVLVCCLFVNYNPNIAANFTSDFTDGEVFYPQNGTFDFRDFSIQSNESENFTVKIMSNGYTRLVDDTGNITINFLQSDNMIHSQRDWNEYILNHELEKPSWSVDGVMVHEIKFIFHDELYSAFIKNCDNDTIIYLATPSAQHTADMVNSLTFKEE